MKNKLTLTALALAVGSLGSANAQIFSEFEPNPAGTDNPTQQVELFGTPTTSFDLWILSLENDGHNGTVDRASNVTGVFDMNGIAVVEIGDLENPSNTLVLTDAFTGSSGDDLDASDDGNLDLSSLGNILDAVGVSDSTSDNSSLYGSGLGGSNILYNGKFEPLSVFRLESTGEWYNTVTVDFGTANQHVGLFGPTNPTEEILNAPASTLSTTFGSINPSAVPEPSAYALLAGLLGLTCVMLRRRGA